MATTNRTYVLILQPEDNYTWRVHLESWIGDGSESMCTKLKLHDFEASNLIAELGWLHDIHGHRELDRDMEPASHLSPYSVPAAPELDGERSLWCDGHGICYCDVCE